jgi:FkbM family methyltransferase
MVTGYQKRGGMLRELVRYWQTFSVVAKVVLQCVVNTFRLAIGPGEVLGVLRFVFKELISQLKRSSNPQADETLRLQGVQHVLGLGTGELYILQEIYWDRVYERLEDFVSQSGWTVFDVGANSGVYTVQQARRGAHVYAFEPNPDCYRRLRKSVGLNNLENRVTAANCALGAVAGCAQLLVPGRLTMAGSLRPGWTYAGATGLKVEVQTLDRVVQALGINRIDLLKIDVEGFELDVLQGACETFPLIHRLVLEYQIARSGPTNCQVTRRLWTEHRARLQNVPWGRKHVPRGRSWNPIREASDRFCVGATRH